LARALHYIGAQGAPRGNNFLPLKGATMAQAKQQGAPSAADLKAAALILARGQLAAAQADTSGAKLMPAERAQFAGQTFVQYAQARIEHWRAIEAKERKAQAKRAGQSGAKIAKLEARIKALS